MKKIYYLLPILMLLMSMANAHFTGRLLIQYVEVSLHFNDTIRML